MPSRAAIAFCLMLAAGAVTLAGTEPPVRTRYVRPDHPCERVRPRVEARVTISAIVGTDGRVHDATTVDCVTRAGKRGPFVAEPPERCEPFARAVERAVAEWRYRPGRIDRRRTPWPIRVRVDLGLDG